MRGNLFPVSWQNRFFQVIENLELSSSLVYFGLFGFLVFLNHLAPWLEKKLLWGQFDPYQLNFHIWFLVVFFAGSYFISFSRLTLTKFEPAVSMPANEYRKISDKFINFSPKEGWLFTAASIAFTPFAISYAAPYQQSGISQIVFIASSIFMFSLVFMFIVFLFRAMRLTRVLYAKIENLNIYNLNALYAFSGLTSRVGIFFIISVSMSYFTNVFLSPAPQVESFLFFTSLNTVLALAAFIYPLLGIHSRLVAQKEVVSEDINRRLEKAQLKFLKLIDTESYSGATDLKSSISALLELRHEVAHMSTWPWDPSTMRSFITALFLPIILWIIQSFLDQIFQF